MGLQQLTLLNQWIWENALGSQSVTGPNLNVFSHQYNIENKNLHILFKEIVYAAK